MDARKDCDVVAGHGVARRIWRCAAPREANFCVAADCGGCDVNRRADSPCTCCSTFIYFDDKKKIEWQHATFIYGLYALFMKEKGGETNLKMEENMYEYYRVQVFQHNICSFLGSCTR